MKNTGIVYTPDYIARFIIDKIKPSLSNYKSLNILEPSCGDGVFVPLIHKSLSNIKINIEAVEIEKKTCNRLQNLVDNQLIEKLTNTDFISYKTPKKYDLIIGNPPYVNRKHLKKEQIDTLDKFALKYDFLNKKKIRNIWTAFILKSESLLKDNGILAFLLPAQILQVAHAEHIQAFLNKSFERVDILYFNQMIFDDAEQDAVLLIAKKKVSFKEKSGLFISELIAHNKKISSKRTKKFKPVFVNKWTSHTLTNYESSMLNRLLKDFDKLEKYATSSAGVVTAANDYFIVSEETVDKYDLEKYTKPIIKNGAYVNGSVTFSKFDWKVLQDKGIPCHLLDFSGQDIHEKAKKYLNLGLEKKLEVRYKCRQRKKWYEVPSIWGSEGLFFKRSHFYPKLISNEDKILATDSAYRVSMMDGYEMESLIFSFYNSMTLSFAEILGRSYAGGVLELTPNEFRASPIPYTSIPKSDFLSFNEDFSNKNDISEILMSNNNILLKENYNLTEKEVSGLEKIRLKLVHKRLKK